MAIIKGRNFLSCSSKGSLSKVGVPFRFPVSSLECCSIKVCAICKRFKSERLGLLDDGVVAIGIMGLNLELNVSHKL